MNRAGSRNEQGDQSGLRLVDWPEHEVNEASGCDKVAPRVAPILTRDSVLLTDQPRGQCTRVFVGTARKLLGSHAQALLGFESRAHARLCADRRLRVESFPEDMPEWGQTTHTYIHTCMHACIQTYSTVHIHAYIHTYTHTHTHTHRYIECVHE